VGVVVCAIAVTAAAAKYAAARVKVLFFTRENAY
jgi:hypothetical protein